jgi:hypothetical protein
VAVSLPTPAFPVPEQEASFGVRDATTKDAEVTASHFSCTSQNLSEDKGIENRRTNIEVTPSQAKSTPQNESQNKEANDRRTKAEATNQIEEPIETKHADLGTSPATNASSDANESDELRDNEESGATDSLENKAIDVSRTGIQSIDVRRTKIEANDHVAEPMRSKHADSETCSKTNEQVSIHEQDDPSDTERHDNEELGVDDSFLKYLCEHTPYSHKPPHIQLNDSQQAEENDRMYNRYNNTSKELCAYLINQQLAEIDEGIEQDYDLVCCIANAVDLPCPHAPVESAKYSTVTKLVNASKVIKSGAMDIEDFKLAQATDSYCKKIEQGIINGYPRYLHCFEILDGIIYNVDRKKNEKRICLPESLLNHQLFIHHYSIWGMHKSKDKMLADISQYYFHPDLKEKIAEYTSKCYFCIFASKIPGPSQAYGIGHRAHMPRAMWYFDIASGFNEVDGYRYVYLVTDQFSLFTILIAAKTKSSNEIQHAFTEKVMAVFGVPEALRSDRETALSNSDSFTEYAQRHAIKMLLTAAHSPFSNGLSEGRVNLLKISIRKLIMATGDENWPKNLPYVQLAINQTPSYYKYSPEQIMFGSSLKSSLELLSEDRAEMDPETYFNLMQPRLKEIQEKFTLSREDHKERTRNYQNRNRVVKNFKAGDLVWIQNEVIRGKSALTLKNKGPAIIQYIEPLSSSAYVLNKTTGQVTKEHFTHLHPVRTETEAFPPDWDRQIKQAIPK